MKHLKKYHSYDENINEEKGFLKNLFLSTILSLGLNQVDAQTIASDSVKKEIVNDIIKYNKMILLNIPEIDPIVKLKKDLSYKIDEPDTFIEKYLEIQPNRTLVVKPNFVHGLEIYLNRRNFGIGYNIEF